MSREQANLFFQIVAHRYEIAALGTTPGYPSFSFIAHLQINPVLLASLRLRATVRSAGEPHDL